MLGEKGESFIDCFVVLSFLFPLFCPVKVFPGLLPVLLVNNHTKGTTHLADNVLPFVKEVVILYFFINEVKV